MICRMSRLALGIGAVVAGLAGPVLAQPPAPSENATINLIRLLVQQGVLKQEQAQALIQQAEAEAVQARQAAASAPAAPAGVPGEVRVQYVPAIVRDQIRDQVKAEVMAQAKQENWAAPNTFPDWVSRISLEGDVRLRSESRYFADTNSDRITDFARLNDRGPYDVNKNTNTQLPPLLNTREDRENLLRLRAAWACARCFRRAGRRSCASAPAPTAARCPPPRPWAAASARRTSGSTRATSPTSPTNA